MTPLIETQRLALRAPERRDAAPLATHLNNFAVAGNLAQVPYPYSLANAEQWLDSVHDATTPDETNFVIEFGEHGPVGTIGYHLGRGGAQIGYWLGEPFWGQGLMTEAMQAVLDWYFTATDAERVMSGIFHFNTASLAIQMKLGFVETGRSMVHCLARGTEIEHIDTELTRDAFEAFADRRNIMKGKARRMGALA